MQKKAKIVIAVIAAVILLAVGLCAGKAVHNTYLQKKYPAKHYTEYWDIQFPSKLHKTYEKIGTQGFTGDGSRYSVFLVENEQDGFFTDFSEAPAPNEEFVLTVTEQLHQLQIPEEQQPDWASAYKWKYLGQNQNSDASARYFDNLYLIWDTTSNTLFVLEICI